MILLYTSMCNLQLLCSLVLLLYLNTMWSVLCISLYFESSNPRGSVSCIAFVLCYLESPYDHTCNTFVLPSPCDYVSTSENHFVYSAPFVSTCKQFQSDRSQKILFALFQFRQSVSQVSQVKAKSAIVNQVCQSQVNQVCYSYSSQSVSL